MKETTGELNMTIIVVTIVAGLSLFFFSYLWPKIRNNFNGKTKCDMAICPNNPEGTPSVTCYYKDKKGVQHEIICTWKG